MTWLNITRERSLVSSSAENHIASRRKEIARLHEQLATGKRINRASDDASGYAQSRRISVIDDQHAQYLRTIESARLWTDQTQHALDGIAERLMQAHELSLRALNGSASAEDRAIEAAHLDSLLTEVLDLMNAKAGEEYLFAGSLTTTRPFSMTPGGVAYAGDEMDRIRRVGVESAISINVTGGDLHDVGGGLSLTGALQNMIDALRADDRAAMDDALGNLQAAQEHVLALGSRTGATARRLDVVASHVRETRILLESRRSEIADVDMAEAIMKFQREQTGLEAALTVTASVIQTTLLQYLK